MFENGQRVGVNCNFTCPCKITSITSINASSGVLGLSVCGQMEQRTPLAAREIIRHGQWILLLPCRFLLSLAIVAAASLCLLSGFTAFSTTSCGGTTAPAALVRHALPESALKASDSSIGSLFDLGELDSPFSLLVIEDVFL